MKVLIVLALVSCGCCSITVQRPKGEMYTEIRTSAKPYRQQVVDGVDLKMGMKMVW